MYRPGLRPSTPVQTENHCLLSQPRKDECVPIQCKKNPLISLLIPKLHARQSSRIAIIDSDYLVSMVAIDSGRPIRPLRIGGRASGEIRMSASCFGGKSVCWVIFKQRLQELKASWLEIRYDSAGGLTSPFGEGCLEVRERGNAWPG